MVRPIRILFEGATYHVLSKGNLDDFIFSEAKDKGYFLKLLGEGAGKYCADILSYCLMGNHYHLLVRTRKANLPIFMHFLLSSYASYQAREGRKGHIFAGRYRAILVNTEEYLLSVSKYIHLNPVKAALVDSPGEYRWSGYRFYSQGRKVPVWIDREWVMEYYGPELDDSLRRYREFVEADLDKEFPYPNENVVAQAILGNEDFVKEAIAKHRSNISSSQITRKKELVGQISLEEIHQAVCGYYGLNDLRKKEYAASGINQRARKSFVYLARRNTQYSNSDIADVLGNISASGVSESYRRTVMCNNHCVQTRKEYEALEDAILRDILDPTLRMEG
jgi:putative transposase